MQEDGCGYRGALWTPCQFGILRWDPGGVDRHAATASNSGNHGVWRRRAGLRTNLRPYGGGRRRRQHILHSGALIYVLADLALERLAATSPRRAGRDSGDVLPDAGDIPETREQATIGGTALLVGAVLDGIPENAAIGISLGSGGRDLGLVLLAAIFLGNVPESISSAVGMRQEGRSRAYIVGVWGAVTVGCVLATVSGYGLLGGLSPNMISAVLALAAGGILAMLADTMFPEAFANGGPWVAMATSCGFALAFLLSHTTG